MATDLKGLIKNRGIEYFLCSFVELTGAPKAKLVPAAAIEEVAS